MRNVLFLFVAILGFSCSKESNVPAPNNHIADVGDKFLNDEVGKLTVLKDKTPVYKAFLLDGFDPNNDPKGLSLDRHFEEDYSIQRQDEFEKTEHAAYRCLEGKSPPISDEAKSHFITGKTLLNEVKASADYSQIISEFKEAIRLSPVYPEAHYNLGLAYEDKGEFMNAIVELQFYLRIHFLWFETAPSTCEAMSDAEFQFIKQKIYDLKTKAQNAKVWHTPHQEVAPPIISEPQPAGLHCNNDNCGLYCGATAALGGHLPKCCSAGCDCHVSK